MNRAREWQGLCAELALALLGFAAAAAFVPWFGDPAASPRWAAIAVLTPACMLLLERRARPGAPWWCYAWLPAAAVAALWAPSALDAADELVHLVILAGVFYLGAALDDARAAWTGFAAGCVLSAAIGIAQALGLEPVPVAFEGHAAAGLFMNKNPHGEAQMVALVVAAAAGWWVLAACAAVGVIAAWSKAVFGALALVAALWLMPRRRTAAYAILVVTALAAAAAFAVYGSGAERLALWRFVLENFTPFGWGLASFDAYLVTPSGVQRALHAHSEPLHLAHELGLLALPFVALFFYCMGVRTDDTRHERLALAGLAGVSLLAFPFHMPATAFAAALAAGRLAGTRRRLRLGELERGAALHARV